MKSSKKNSHKTENWVPQSADTEQQTRAAFLRAKLNSCCMCSTRRSFFRVKLDLKYNMEEKNKTREIKKKKIFFFEIGYMAPCTSPLCTVWFRFKRTRGSSIWSFSRTTHIILDRGGGGWVGVGWERGGDSAVVVVYVMCILLHLV